MKSTGSLERVRFLRFVIAGSRSMCLRSNTRFLSYLAPKRSVTEIASDHSAACRVNRCHELLKGGTQPHRPLKSLSDDLASTDRTVKPDPDNQGITQNEEQKVAQSKPHLRRELQIVALLRDHHMGTHYLGDLQTRAPKPGKRKSCAFALKHSLDFRRRFA